MTVPLEQATRTRRFGVYFALTLLACAVAVMWERYLTGERRQQLADKIEEAGGKTVLPPTPVERVRMWYYGGAVEETTVVLEGANFNDEWLANNLYPPDLEIRVLIVRKTEISDSALARLIDSHSLEQFEIEGQTCGPATARALGKQKKMVYIGLRKGVGIDEQDFAQLPLEDVKWLKVEDSNVTSSALQQLKCCRTLLDVSFDGTQWDDKTSQVIQSLGTVKWLTLQGMNSTVGDEHLGRAERVDSLELVVGISTSITPERVEYFKQARQNCKLSLD